jgi:hypothetical protein
MISRATNICVAAAAALLLSGTFAVKEATAATFSFIGNLSVDDEIQLFKFTVGATSNVTLATLSYSGGVNSAGQTIESGGFDPILALFDAAGNTLASVDDVAPSLDATILATLGAGTYTLALTQYDNFSGATIAELFDREGDGNFITGTSRALPWALDIIGVDTAAIDLSRRETSPIPLPAAIWLFGAAVAGAGYAGRRVRKKQA